MVRVNDWTCVNKNKQSISRVPQHNVYKQTIKTCSDFIYTGTLDTYHTSSRKKCGIYPFNRDGLLSQLPAAAADFVTNPKESVTSLLIAFLDKMRFKPPAEIGEGSGTTGGRGRGRRFDVPPGKSVCEDNIPPPSPCSSSC